MIRIAIVIFTALSFFILGGAVGQYLTDERLGDFIRVEDIRNSITYHEHLSEVRAEILSGNNQAALEGVNRLILIQEISLESCLKHGCPDDLRSEAAKILHNNQRLQEK